MDTLRNENGFSVLLLALMVLLVMTALGAAMLQTTQRELRSVTKLKLSTQALYSAESGVSIAVAELSTIRADSIDDFDGSIDSTNPWKDELLTQLLGIQGGTALFPYIPAQHEFSFDEEPYTLNIRFNTKVTFVGTGLNILCYGMKGSAYKFEVDTLQYFYSKDKKVGRDFWPIFEITSIGKEGNEAGGLFKYAERNVQIMIRAEPSFSFPEAALTLNGDLDPTGENHSPSSIVGEGRGLDCGAEDIVGVDGKDLTYPGNTDWCTTEADPEGFACAGNKEVVSNPEGYPVDVVVAALIQQGTEIDPTNGPLILGSSPDDVDGIYYYKGNVEYEDTFEQNNIEGYGILVIDGNLILGGKIEWRGLIIVTGDVRLHGGGGPERYIDGALIAGGNVEIVGNPDIFCDCTYMLELWKSSAAWEMKWWKEIKGRI